MTKNPPITQIYSSGVLSLLPMFYVAWADRVLSPTEVKLLEDKIANLSFLTENEKFTLKKREKKKKICGWWKKRKKKLR